MSVIVEFKRKKIVFDPLMKENYHAYLQSPEWKEKRRAVILRAGKRCEECGKYLGYTGEVHHKTYDQLFEEDLDDLRYKCTDCHQF